MSKVGMAFAATAGIVAGAAIHACACACISREEQRNICRNSRHMVKVAKRKMRM